jgi:hypothetical protein
MLLPSLATHPSLRVRSAPFPYGLRKKSASEERFGRTLRKNASEEQGALHFFYFIFFILFIFLWLNSY